MLWIGGVLGEKEGLGGKAAFFGLLWRRECVHVSESLKFGCMGKGRRLGIPISGAE